MLEVVEDVFGSEIDYIMPPVRTIPGLFDTQKSSTKPRSGFIGLGSSPGLLKKSFLFLLGRNLTNFEYQDLWLRIVFEGCPSYIWGLTEFILSIKLT